jgi:DNA-binding NtrC family response regulator
MNAIADEKTKELRLLLVDDEVDFLNAAVKAMSRRGFEVEHAPNASAALELLSHHVFDVAVLDVKMPGINGIQLFKKIQSQWKNTAVIMLTGHANVQDAFSTSRDGVFDYIAKPCNFDELASLCHEAAQSGDHDKDSPEQVDEPVDILIVDDERDITSTMKKVLSRRNMTVETASDGAEALTMIMKHVPHVIVLDLRMPGLPGLEVLRRVKRLHPDVEVILLTGHPTISLALQGVRAGAFDFMVKPQDVDMLTDKIREAARARKRKLVSNRKTFVERLLTGFAD